MRRQKAFTLIELLVVIAIIGILAAMVFPVFARARESARKAVCLSNIKNIALAWQMYLGDYDAFPPLEHRQDVLDYIATTSPYAAYDWCKWLLPGSEFPMNPYLRVPVILDEYTKNRDVWRCPSGRIQTYFGINPCVPDWFTSWKETSYDCAVLTCNVTYPPGWGGAVTDSRTQQGCGGGGEVLELVGTLRSGGAAKSFAFNYDTPKTARDTKLSAVENASKFVIVGEANSAPYALATTAGYPYENTAVWAYGVCNIPAAACSYCSVGVGLDEGYAPLFAITSKIATDPNYRKNDQWAKPRHLGGNNMGFADGHAAWINSEAILFGGKAVPGAPLPAGDLFDNLYNCGFGTPIPGQP